MILGLCCCFSIIFDQICRKEDVKGIRQRCSIPEGMDIKKSTGGWKREKLRKH